MKALQNNRVAFFVSEFPSLSETFVINQIVDLKKRGFIVDIYARSRGKQSIIHNTIAENGLLKDTILLDEFPKKRTRKCLLLCKTLFRYFSFQNIALVLNFIRKAPAVDLSVYDIIPYLKSGYAVVHAHFGVNGNYVAKLKSLGLFQSSRFVTSFHGYDLELEKGNRNFYKKLFTICHVFTVNSEFARRKLQNIGCPADKIWKIPVGLDTTIFVKKNAPRKPSNEFTILFIGRLIPLKGPDVVLEISSLLRKRKHIQFSTVIVGEGGEKQKLEDLIRNAGLADVVQLVGPKSQAEVKELMNDADVFLFPGRTVDGVAETQGLVIQEAQAMSLPVLISDAGGMKEGIIDGVTGFVLPENKPEAFVEKIELLAKDEHKRRQLGIAGRNHVINKYDSAQLSKVLIKLYQN